MKIIGGEEGAQAKEAVSELRGDRTDLEWYEYLCKIAAVQEEILNRHAAEIDATFEVRVKTGAVEIPVRAALEGIEREREAQAKDDVVKDMMEGYN